MIALGRTSFAPWAEQLPVSWIAPTLERGSQNLLGAEHALQSSDPSFDVLVQRAPHRPSP